SITCHSRLMTFPWEVDAIIFDFLSTKERFKRLKRYPYKTKYKDLFKIISKCGIYMAQEDPKSKVEFKLDGTKTDISCFDGTDPGLVSFFLRAFKLNVEVHYEKIQDYVTKSHVIRKYGFDGSLRLTINDENILPFLENNQTLVGISKLFVDIKAKQITQRMLDSIAKVLQLSSSVKHFVMGNAEIPGEINNFMFNCLLDSFKNLESLKMIFFELKLYQVEYLANNILPLGNLKTLDISISYKDGFWINGKNIMQILADNLKNIEDLRVDCLGKAEDLEMIYFFEKIAQSNVKRLAIHGFFNFSREQALTISQSYGNLRELRLQLYYANIRRIGTFIKHMNQYNIETLEIPIEHTEIKVSWHWIATHTKNVKQLIIVNAHITIQDMHLFLSNVSPTLEFLDLLQTTFAIEKITHFTSLLLKTNIKYLKLPTLNDEVLRKLKDHFIIA
ncbi:hypothetical protein ROZALSC1DRAFT_28841, partial [Rozella allomycis CSF55]